MSGKSDKNYPSFQEAQKKLRETATSLKGHDHHRLSSDSMEYLREKLGDYFHEVVADDEE